MPQQKGHNNKPQAARRGVTLIEIAIVLVIIGILLGGVLKGQELINNARVRAISDQQTSIRAAWFSFLSRFGGMPADYPFASQHIPQAPDGDGDGIIVMWESPIAFLHLTNAGFLRCRQCADAVEDEPTTGNSLVNTYGGIMAIFHNGQFGGTPIDPVTDVTYASRAPNQGAMRLMIHSGERIPSNIVAEVDRKIDDGIANEGEIVFNRFGLLGAMPNSIPFDCTSTDRTKQAAPMVLVQDGPLYYRHRASENPAPNCGFSSYI